MLKYSKLFQKASFLAHTQKYGFSFNKVVNSVDEALNDVKDGHTILVGGFGLCGIPQTLINGIKEKGTKDLTIVSNDIGTDELGLGILLKDKCQVKKCVSSFIGENRYLGKLYIGGEIAVEFTPQGTLAEKCRAGGAGIPAFFTPTGAGTIVETGGIINKYKKGTTEPEILSPAKRAEEWNGKRYILEPSIQGDIAFIKAWKADTKGNLIFNKSARNMNDDFAKAAKITIAEVEEIVEAGELDPSHIHVPGIFVSKVIRAVDREKKIAKPMFADSNKNQSHNLTPEQEIRKSIAKRACKEVKNGMYINLGIGIPTLIPAHLPTGVNVELESENGVLGVGNYPERGQEDADLINAGKETITVNAGGSFFSSSESFGIIRGRHLDMTVLGGMQVSSTGDLANWIVPGKLVKGMGGAMDLVGSGTKVMVCMQHTEKNGAPKILKDCCLPLTGKAVVNVIVTERATFEFINGELYLKEIAEGYTLEDIVKSTGCEFKLADNIKSASLGSSASTASVYA